MKTTKRIALLGVESVFDLGILSIFSELNLAIERAMPAT